MPKQNERVDILGIKVDTLTIEESIERIIARTQQPGCHYVVKPYVEFFGNGHEEVVNRAWLSLPDGVALQWASYFQTTNGSLWQLFRTASHIIFRPQRISQILPERFAGINFTWPLLEKAATADVSVYLVGSPKGGTIDDTGRWLRDRIPGLYIIGTCPGRDDSGIFSKRLEERLLDDLHSKRPGLVLIGIGFPRQEYLMERLNEQLNHGVLIGEGGTFDYQQFGGQRRKAPRWMQRIGLEWLWRLLLEPSRLKRQLAIPRFMWQVYRDLQRQKR